MFKNLNSHYSRRAILFWQDVQIHAVRFLATIKYFPKRLAYRGILARIGSTDCWAHDCCVSDTRARVVEHAHVGNDAASAFARRRWGNETASGQWPSHPAKTCLVMQITVHRPWLIMATVMVTLKHDQTRSRDPGQWNKSGKTHREDRLQLKRELW